jgi:ribulose-phosphate 3-epimerase
LAHFDTRVIMSAEPGRGGGQRFVPEALDKIRSARWHIDSEHLPLLIQIHGGIGIDTIRSVTQAEADCDVVDSGIYGIGARPAPYACCASTPTLQANF